MPLSFTQHCTRSTTWVSSGSLSIFRRIPTTGWQSATDCSGVRYNKTMLVHAVDRPEVPPLRMPERFRTDVAYFMTPSGEHGVEKMPQGEYWIRRDDVRTWLADGV